MEGTAVERRRVHGESGDAFPAARLSLALGGGVSPTRPGATAEHVKEAGK
jgi:hypothetical protein